MGFIDRAGRVLSGVVDAVQAPFGLVKDFVTAPWKDDDEFDGFLHTINKRVQVRTGQVFGNLFGPTEGLGAAIGGIPEPIRNPVGKVYEGFVKGSEWIYKNIVSEPIATGVLALQGESLTSAYKKAQTTSMGQSAALLFGLEPGTDGYEIVSGTTDAVARWFLDPTVVGAKAVAAGRVKYVVRPVKAGADVSKIAASARSSKFLEGLMGKNPAEIRALAFPDHAHGSAVSVLLHDGLAAGGIEGGRTVLTALMGDLTALKDIQKGQAAVGAEIQRLLGIDDLDSVWHPPSRPDVDRPLGLPPADAPTAQVGEYDRFAASRFNGSRRGPTAAAAERVLDDPVVREIDDLYRAEDRLQRLESVQGVIRNEPRLSAISAAREGIVRSDFYQRSFMARPLRSVFMMRSEGRVVNFHDLGGDVMVARMTRRSGLSQVEQDFYRSNYMQAANPGERRAMMQAAEEASVRRIGERRGLSAPDLDGLMETVRTGRGESDRLLQSRVYDGKGRSKVGFLDEAGHAHEINLPAFVTQEQNLMALANLDDVDKAVRRLGRERSRFGKAAELSIEALEGFTRIWKPTVLLRVGWPLRVIFDEQLRIMSQIGVLAQMKEITSATYQEAVGRLKGVPKGERGLRDMEINGYRMQSAFGTPGDTESIWAQRVSSADAFRTHFQGPAAEGLEGMRQSAQGWASKAPHEKGYDTDWAHAVNNQIGKDRVGRMFLEGRSVEEVTNWLRRTPEGRTHARRLGRRDLETWAQQMHDIVGDYTLGDAAIMREALKGRARFSHLEDAAPDFAQRPIVHGEVLEQAKGTSQIQAGIRKTVEVMYENLGRKPTDFLSRNRYFDHLYRNEVDRLVTHFDAQAKAAGERLTHETLRTVENQARTYALGEVKSLLYDLAEGSQLSHILRFAAPFYSAWQEVLTRWAHIAIENPAFVRRMQLAYQAPERAGLVTDENGYIVREDGNAYDPVTDKLVGEAGEDRYITMRLLPEAIKNIPGVRALENVSFNKQSISFLTTGTPGAGVPVQIPVNWIVKGRPELEDSVDFILPYGTSPDIKSMLMSATIKRGFSLFKGDEDRAYRNAKIRIFQTMAVDHNLGKTDVAPTWEEATKRANKLFSLRVFTSFVSPVALTMQSPYQIYIDSYRQARERLAEDPQALADSNGSPRTVDEWFLDTYGEEYFPLTESMTQGINGIPPTVEAFKAKSRYKDLIDRHPELGSLIIGEEGAGEFSRAVYDSQFAKDVGGRASRRPKTEEEIEAGPDVRAGWIAYRKAMDIIDAERVERGLPNLQVAAARDLGSIKRLMIAKLKVDHPGWAQEFGVVDRNKWPNRLAGFREIAADDRMAARPEIRGLRLYLEARDLVTASLTKRDAHTLDAVANQDLARLWDALRQKMADDNPAFADLYYRWLEHDPVEVA